ncbi:MAG: hypothetical protein A2Y63_04610 [Candidatus Riflebacteria bacterium RBG_13_59_9]|nr:MAG: hypothetical protein A2Y63_04610 [Candidatus Riflebacteria bacterium RBG_13_59_9]
MLEIVLVVAALSASCFSSTGVGSASPGIEQPEESQLQVLLLDFSGSRAFELLKKQVALGPRVPGSRPHQQCRELIADTLAPFCEGITEQDFSDVVNGHHYDFHNLLAYQNPHAERLVILAAHYDTRPFADRDSPQNYATPIPGANDGASGVAVLLELARVLHGRLPENVGLLFLFTDGEDTGLATRQMFKGAEYFASNMPTELRQRIAFGVLLDMIGDANLNIKPEKNSEAVASGIYSALLELQDSLGLQGFLATGQNTICDDHLAFIERGVKMYDVIDFDYRYWHTLEDTVDRCSPQSLQTVGLCVGNLILNYAAGKFSI